LEEKAWSDSGMPPRAILISLSLSLAFPYRAVRRETFYIQKSLFQEGKQKTQDDVSKNQKLELVCFRQKPKNLKKTLNSFEKMIRIPTWQKKNPQKDTKERKVWEKRRACLHCSRNDTPSQYSHHRNRAYYITSKYVLYWRETCKPLHQSHPQSTYIIATPLFASSVAPSFKKWSQIWLVWKRFVRGGCKNQISCVVAQRGKCRCAMNWNSPYFI